MGLSVSHKCWSASYSTFMRWRAEVARAAGFPPLMLMEEYYDFTDITPEDVSTVMGRLAPNLYYTDAAWALALVTAFQNRSNFPIRWGMLKIKPSLLPLVRLLHHSDCEGELEWFICNNLADALEEIIPSMNQDEAAGYVERTRKFIEGLRDAYDKKENVEFR